MESHIVLGQPGSEALVVLYELGDRTVVQASSPFTSLRLFSSRRPVLPKPWPGQGALDLLTYCIWIRVLVQCVLTIH